MDIREPRLTIFEVNDHLTIQKREGDPEYTLTASAKSDNSFRSCVDDEYITFSFQDLIDLSNTLSGMISSSVQDGQVYTRIRDNNGDGVNFIIGSIQADSPGSPNDLDKVKNMEVVGTGLIGHIIQAVNAIEDASFQFASAETGYVLAAKQNLEICRVRLFLVLRELSRIELSTKRENKVSEK